MTSGGTRNLRLVHYRLAYVHADTFNDDCPRRERARATAEMHARASRANIIVIVLIGDDLMFTLPHVL